MNPSDFERRTIEAAEATFPSNTLAQLVFCLASEARAADHALAMGQKLDLCEACTQLILASAWLIDRCGLSWTAALLDAHSRLIRMDGPHSPAVPAPRGRRRKSA